MRNGKEDIPTDTTETQKTKSEYDEQLKCQQMWQPRRNGQHLRHMNSPYQGEIDMLNRIIIKNEIKYIRITFTTRSSSGHDGFRSKLYQTYMKEFRHILLNLLPKVQEQGTLPRTFDEATFTLILK